MSGTVTYLGVRRIFAVNLLFTPSAVGSSTAKAQKPQAKRKTSDSESWIRQRATWVTAWCILGHCPRPSLDDPKSISPIVDVPYEMLAFSVTFGFVICSCTGLLLTGDCGARRSDPRPLMALPFAWVPGYIALMLDPLGVLYWYMD